MRSDAPAPASRAPRTLVIACGAIAHELVAVLEAAGLAMGAGDGAAPGAATDAGRDASAGIGGHAGRSGPIRIECLPADYHDTPERIVPAVAAKLDAAEAAGMGAFVAYGDCGTGGQLDALLDARGVARLPGAHCYAFFAGIARFEALAEAEPGTFWLTDWLARNFDRLVLRGLGIDRHPELLDTYFAHYTRVVHLVQDPDPDGLVARAATRAAASLGLPLRTVHTGLGPFADALRPGLPSGPGARTFTLHPASPPSSNRACPN